MDFTPRNWESPKNGHPKQISWGSLIAMRVSKSFLCHSDWFHLEIRREFGQFTANKLVSEITTIWSPQNRSFSLLLRINKFVDFKYRRLGWTHWSLLEPIRTYWSPLQPTGVHYNVPELIYNLPKPIAIYWNPLQPAGPIWSSNFELIALPCRWHGCWPVAVGPASIVDELARLR